MRRWVALLVIFSLAEVACETAAGESSVTALLRVEGAQSIPGPPPEAGEGPLVSGVTLLQARIWPGQIDKPISGTLQAGATAVSLYLAGDRAHYILPAGAPDITAPLQPSFHASLAFSPLLPLGPHRLLVQATDLDGRYGIASGQNLVADNEPPPQGALVIALSWERGADLDLHVEEPSGQEIWSGRKGGSAPSSPDQPPPAMDAGYLDVDSNAQCVIDGRQRENVIYRTAAAPGLYKVRVDTFSLCGQATAYWQVEAWAAGTLLLAARGQSLPTATRGEHGQGAGVLALQVKVP